MKKTDKITLRQKAPAELKSRLAELNKQIVENKSQLHNGGLKNTSVFKKANYEIALIKSIISEYDRQK
ncbi:MAG TPA: 50S ribosomal protein L29 [Candidatus Woesebacteria bacterium]|nr:50S ribosomal protein L29 [Candidatus Woesebacteria bacterium]HPJ16833.1 50S ribosomal protein L29 [Candidatus Woesebacteria bacterium]